MKVCILHYTYGLHRNCYPLNLYSICCLVFCSLCLNKWGIFFAFKATNSKTRLKGCGYVCTQSTGELERFASICRYCSTWHTINKASSCITSAKCPGNPIHKASHMFPIHPYNDVGCTDVLRSFGSIFVTHQTLRLHTLAWVSDKPASVLRVINRSWHSYSTQYCICARFINDVYTSCRFRTNICVFFHYSRHIMIQYYHSKKKSALHGR